MSGRTLYFGLRLPPSKRGKWEHFPLIQTTPTSIHDPELKELFWSWGQFTHILFTSRTAVEVCQTLMQRRGVYPRGCAICVGQATALQAERAGWREIMVAEEETAEGVIHLLERLSLHKSHVFWPHSALSRPLISQYLAQRGVPFRELIAYQTTPRLLSPEALPSLDLYDRWIFTSPSTVKAFEALFSQPIELHKARAIGPITQRALERAVRSAPLSSSQKANSF